jgi:hypothetical protein
MKTNLMSFPHLYFKVMIGTLAFLMYNSAIALGQVNPSESITPSPANSEIFYSFFNSPFPYTNGYRNYSHDDADRYDGHHQSFSSNICGIPNLGLSVCDQKLQDEIKERDLKRQTEAEANKK